MKAVLRCAIYTRVSTEAGLAQEFNSLDNQREAAEAYIKSQAHEGWRLVRDRYDDGGFSGGSTERPALQRLLDAIRGRRIDVVVVYKVDRLTRSLADFAKLVELFDAHGVSFVSVTQAFNTTNSMGRLTLNVLLSFAQFEREVTGERIRDKIAASKRRGLWVGGNVPLGYRVEAKKLVVIPEEAEQVRLIFRRYLELGSIGQLLVDLRERKLVTKALVRNGIVVRGAIPFARGTLAYLLRNRFYIGELCFKGGVHPAEHPPILDHDLFDAVQAHLTANCKFRTRSRSPSGAILIGKLIDARGRRMTPTHATKGGRQYRYYISAETPGDASGPVCRVPAQAIERPVLDAVRAAVDATDRDDGSLCASYLHCVEIGASEVVIRLCDEQVIRLPWQLPSFRRHHGVHHPVGRITRPMRAETRAALLEGMAKSRRWLDEIATGTCEGPDAIASREGCSARHVNRTLSLAFIAPDIVEAAIAGRLPHGIGLRELTDVPAAWNRQRVVAGLG